MNGLVKSDDTFVMHPDASNGYEAVATEFLAGRGSGTGSAIGLRTVRQWVATLKPCSSVLDLGCGPGYPITTVLVDAGRAVCGVDASPTLVAAFRERFPGVPVECNTVERSDFFGRQFDAVIAWGLVFLLPPVAQEQLIDKVARVLTRGGRFVFTAPPLPIEWSDAMTGQRSESLGADAYRRIIKVAGLELAGETEDEGENHYYMTVKP
jgi:SAM-dependent methyltransferase